jgi:polysaccharide export outer membrane protein
MFAMKLFSAMLGCAALLTGAASAQQQPPPFTIQRQGAQSPAAAPASNYVLGPDDEIFIAALHVPEIAQTPIRLDSEGAVNLPMAGRVKLAGLTTSQAEARLTDLLKEYVKDPEVSVRVAQMHSQPVSVLGEVRQPGVFQLQGKKTLAEIIAQAGGLAPEAGYAVKITRKTQWGMIPVLGNKKDVSGQYYVAEVGLASFMDAHAPGDNILVCPDDVITVPRASLVYVIGEVRKPGGFALHDRGGVSVLKALSLSEGLSRTAALSGARIIRNAPGGNGRRQIALDLKKILEGKAEDPQLAPDDILFVPNSTAKSVLMRGAEAAVQAATGAAIWRL